MGFKKRCNGVDKPSTPRNRCELRFVGGHCELDICPRFIQEMMQDSARNNISSSRTTSIDSFFDDVDTIILLQLLPAPDRVSLS